MGVLDLLLLSTAVVCSTGKLVTFDNTKPRLDSTGAIINAHDGTTQVSRILTLARLRLSNAEGNRKATPMSSRWHSYAADCPGWPHLGSFAVKGRINVTLPSPRLRVLPQPSLLALPTSRSVLAILLPRNGLPSLH